MIRTPDQRLRVFVSSTLAELAEERAAVAKAITALRLTPVLFELGARPHPPRDLYRAYLDQSDIFVGLYWQRYGWVAPDMEISGLEDELLLSGSLPRLLYVKTPAPDREPGLTAMIERLQTEATDSYRPFRTARELGRLVRDDLAVLLSESFASRRATATATAPPAPSPRPRRSLPVATTSLIGREHDIDEVAKLLEEPDVRLVTLTGLGGIGKTRLAVAVGERLDDRFPGGVVFAPLASITEPELVLPRLAAVLDAPLEGARSALDVLVERLADTPTLLVLDNLEQVVGIAPQLDELLARCPGLKILATSRTVLRLRVEHEYPVAPLAVPAFPNRPALAELAALPAVELFVDRARSVRRDFALTDDNALAVAEICRRLDGLPLAIELAAARIRLLEPAALLARLGDRLDALGTGPVDLPERQRTLRATVEWSVDLLSDDERTTLATLAVFVDGWTIEGAMHVAELPEDRALDLLDALAGHSLVQVAASDGGPRFRMLQAVREFAADLLAATPALAAVDRRHADHFRHLVEDADVPLRGIDQMVWADRLQADEGNLRQAIRWFFAHDPQALPHLFRVLWLFWQLKDHMAEGRVWVEELLPRAATLTGEAQVELALAEAVTAIEVGDDDGALAAADRIRQLHDRNDDPFLEALMQLMVAWILPIVDEYDTALDAAATALDLLRPQDEPFMTASAVMTLGMLEATVGRHDDARRHLAELEVLGDRLVNNWFTSSARVQLVPLTIQAGHLDETRALLDGALAKDDAELSTHTVTFYLVAFARLALAEGTPERAALALGAAEGLRHRAGLRVWPSMRRSEAELLDRVRQALEPAAFDAAFTAGSQLSRREALAVVRDDG